MKDFIWPFISLVCALGSLAAIAGHLRDKTANSDSHGKDEDVGDAADGDR